MTLQTCVLNLELVLKLCFPLSFFFEVLVVHGYPEKCKISMNHSVTVISEESCVPLLYCLKAGASYIIETNVQRENEKHTFASYPA